jgi:hypothetical protein
MKPYRDMAPEEKAEARAILDAVDDAKPEAPEPDAPAIFQPGAVVFVDDRFRAASPDLALLWPMAQQWIEHMLSFLPRRHRVEYWRERVERGASLLVAFFDTEANVAAAGIVNLEALDDGRRVACASLMTFNERDLSDLSMICETIALLSGAQGAAIWTPQPVALCSGWSHEDSACGFLQTIAVEPLQ